MDYFLPTSALTRTIPQIAPNDVLELFSLVSADADREIAARVDLHVKYNYCGADLNAAVAHEFAAKINEISRIDPRWHLVRNVQKQPIYWKFEGFQCRCRNRKFGPFDTPNSVFDTAYLAITNDGLFRHKTGGLIESAARAQICIFSTHMMLSRGRKKLIKKICYIVICVIVMAILTSAIRFVCQIVD